MAICANAADAAWRASGAAAASAEVAATLSAVARVLAAVAVIGGLITSTLLSLVVIPAAYTVIDDVSRRFKRRNGVMAQ